MATYIPPEIQLVAITLNGLDQQYRFSVATGDIRPSAGIMVGPGWCHVTLIDRGQIPICGPCWKGQLEHDLVDALPTLLTALWADRPGWPNEEKAQAVSAVMARGCRVQIDWLGDVQVELDLRAPGFDWAGFKDRQLAPSEVQNISGESGDVTIAPHANRAGQEAIREAVEEARRERRTPLTGPELDELGRKAFGRVWREYWKVINTARERTPPPFTGPTPRELLEAARFADAAEIRSADA